MVVLSEADFARLAEVARKIGQCTRRESPPMARSRAYKGVRRVQSRFKVERYLPLDIRKLHDYGLLKPGTEGSVLLKAADGTRIATASLLISPSKLRVQLESVVCSVPTEIRIERTACPFGGTRPWFRCRRCNSRRAILYGLDEDDSFSCRRCMGLVYSSQDETKMKRLWRKQNRIEAKLAGRYRCARPKGMHWETFRRISGDLNTVLRKQNHLFAERARKFLDRYGWPLDYRR
jgi:hypothetical protein